MREAPCWSTAFRSTSAEELAAAAAIAAPTLVACLPREKAPVPDLAGSDILVTRLVVFSR